jgi:hypothetical protein
MEYSSLFKPRRNYYLNYHVFPISKKRPIIIEHICLCVQCNRVYLEIEGGRDYGVCSFDCGLRVRGMSRSDFL